VKDQLPPMTATSLTVSMQPLKGVSMAKRTNNRLKKDPVDERIQVVKGNCDVLTVTLLNSINKGIASLTEEVRKLNGRQE